MSNIEHLDDWDFDLPNNNIEYSSYDEWLKLMGLDHLDDGGKYLATNQIDTPENYEQNPVVTDNFMEMLEYFLNLAKDEYRALFIKENFKFFKAEKLIWNQEFKKYFETVLEEYIRLSDYKVMIERLKQNNPISFEKHPYINMYYYDNHRNDQVNINFNYSYNCAVMGVDRDNYLLVFPVKDDQQIKLYKDFFKTLNVNFPFTIENTGLDEYAITRYNKSNSVQKAYTLTEWVNIHRKALYQYVFILNKKIGSQQLASFSNKLQIHDHSSGTFSTYNNNIDVVLDNAYKNGFAKTLNIKNFYWQPYASYAKGCIISLFFQSDNNIITDSQYNLLIDGKVPVPTTPNLLKEKTNSQTFIEKVDNNHSTLKLTTAFCVTIAGELDPFLRATTHYHRAAYIKIKYYIFKNGTYKLAYYLMLQDKEHTRIPILDNVIDEVIPLLRIPAVEAKPYMGNYYDEGVHLIRKEFYKLNNGGRLPINIDVMLPPKNGELSMFKAGEYITSFYCQDVLCKLYKIVGFEDIPSINFDKHHYLFINHIKEEDIYDLEAFPEVTGDGFMLLSDESPIKHKVLPNECYGIVAEGVNDILHNLLYGRTNYFDESDISYPNSIKTTDRWSKYQIINAMYNTKFVSFTSYYNTSEHGAYTTSYSQWIASMENKEYWSGIKFSQEIVNIDTQNKNIKYGIKLNNTYQNKNLSMDIDDTITLIPY